MQRFRITGIYLLGVVASFAIAIWVLSFRGSAGDDAADAPPMSAATQR
jgi:hypothetical protein